MPSVLFLCTANRFRSPLAAAFLRRNLAELEMSAAWQITSAGTWATPGLPVMPGVAQAAREFGLDLSSHRSTRISADLLAGYDLIVVMQSSQREALLTEYPHLQERVYLLSDIAERRTYDIPDALGSQQEMLEVVTELEALIRRGLESLCVLATSLSNARSRN